MRNRNRKSGRRDLLDRAFRFRGPCAICGGPDARHRLWDSIDTLGRLDGVSFAASDFGVSEGQVRLVMAAFEEARRGHRALPGRDHGNR